MKRGAAPLGPGIYPLTTTAKNEAETYHENDDTYGESVSKYSRECILCTSIITCVILVIKRVINGYLKTIIRLIALSCSLKTVSSSVVEIGSKHSCQGISFQGL